MCVLTSCSRGENHVHGHEEGEDAHGVADEIVLSPAKAEAAGVKVETVQTGTFYGVIRAGGQILAVQGDEVAVVASTAGVVSFVHPLTEGVAVDKDGTLLTVSGDRIQDGDAVNRARIAYETAKDEYERAAKLADSRIVPRKELNKLKEAYENARLAYGALTPSPNGKGVAVSSPIGGYVKQCLVKEGDYVAVGQPLVVVTRTRRLQLRAEVSERHYAALRQVHSAHFRTSADSAWHRLEDFHGHLLSYGKSTGEDSFYVPLTFEFDNRGDLLPGSYAEVCLLTAPREGVVSVPVSALTEEEGVTFVYVRTDEECYRKKEVKTGMDNGIRVEIRSGLEAGEQVVAEGAVHVKLASASNAIPAHTHNH